MGGVAKNRWQNKGAASSPASLRTFSKARTSPALLAVYTPSHRRGFLNIGCASPNFKEELLSEPLRTVSSACQFYFSHCFCHFYYCIIIIIISFNIFIAIFVISIIIIITRISTFIILLSICFIIISIFLGATALPCRPQWLRWLSARLLPRQRQSQN